MEKPYVVGIDIGGTNTVFAGGALTEVNFGRIDAFGSEFSLNWRDKIGVPDRKSVV